MHALFGEGTHQAIAVLVSEINVHRIGAMIGGTGHAITIRVEGAVGDLDSFARLTLKAAFEIVIKAVQRGFCVNRILHVTITNTFDISRQPAFLGIGHTLVSIDVREAGTYLAGLKDHPAEHRTSTR